MTVLRKPTGRARRRLRLGAALALAVCAMALLALPCAAKAASYDIDVTVPVKVSCPKSVEGSPEFTFEMEPVGGAPAAGPVSVACIDGEGAGSFVVHFDAPGDYRYTVRQTGETPDRWTLDDGEWDVLIQVLRGADGSVAPNVVIQRAGGGAKFSAVTFTNDYVPPAQPPVTPPTEGGGGEVVSPETKPVLSVRPVQGGLPKLGDGAALWIVLLVAALCVGLTAWRVASRS